jgi:hypothetical protein
MLLIVCDKCDLSKLHDVINMHLFKIRMLLVGLDSRSLLSIGWRICKFYASIPVPYLIIDQS